MAKKSFFLGCLTSLENIELRNKKGSLINKQKTYGIQKSSLFFLNLKNILAKKKKEKIFFFSLLTTLEDNIEKVTLPL